MQLSNLVFYARVVARTVAFYQALGVEMHPRSQGRYVGEVGGVRIAVAEAVSGEPAAPQVAPGSVMVGFEVADTDAAVLAVHPIGGAVVRGPEQLSWGRRVLLTDPDGRTVEVVDRRSA